MIDSASVYLLALGSLLVSQNAEYMCVYQFTNENENGIEICQQIGCVLKFKVFSYGFGSCIILQVF